MLTLAERLRAARSARRLTQEQLAPVLGVSRSMVAMYERGEHEPRIAQLEAVASHLGVSAVWLTLGHGPMSEGSNQRAA